MPLVLVLWITLHSYRYISLLPMTGLQRFVGTEGISSISYGVVLSHFGLTLENHSTLSRM